MYRIIIPLKVQKELKRIDNKKQQLRIAKALISLEINPFIGKKLGGKFKDCGLMDKK